MMNQGSPLARMADEAEALLGYAAETGLLTGETAAETQELRTAVVEPLARAVAAVREGADDDATRVAMLMTYSALRRRTGAITGRSVIESPLASREGGGLLWFAPVVLALAMLTLILALAQAATAPAERHAVFSLLCMATWGAFGSTTYLLKRLHDLSQTRAFEVQQFTGPWVRVMLGAALAVVFYLLLADKPTGPFDPTLAPVAFLVGLSVKVFYGVLENAVEALSERFGLSISQRLSMAPRDSVGKPMAQPVPKPAPPPEPLPAAAKAWSDGRAVQVVELQTLLMGFGRYPGPANGVLDREVIEAAASMLRLDPPEAVCSMPIEAVLERLRTLGLPGSSTPSGPLSPDERAVRDHLMARGLVEGEPPEDRKGFLALLARADRDLAEEFGDADVPSIARKLEASRK